MRKTYLYIAWTLALAATAGSLLLSYGLHWDPCDLCWYQRLFMFPLVIILGAAILKDIPQIGNIVFPMAGIGAGFSIFHNLLLYRLIPADLSPCSSGVSCTAPYHFFHPLITVPLLTLVGFLAIIMAMVMHNRSRA